MLQQLLHILIVSIICFIWGLPAFIYLTKNEKENFWLSKGMGIGVFLFFTGFITLSFFSSWVVLFLPLRFEYLLIATFLLTLYCVTQFSAFKKKISILIKTKSRFKFPAILFLISTILLFIVLGTLKPVNIDTQLYHLQIIKWTNEYGAIPGVANLYPRLGLGSGLFNLISLFHIPIFENQNFSYLNTTLTIWFLIWLINKWNYYKNKSNNPFSLFFFLLLLYFLFDWQLFRDTANSTSYDFIVTSLSIIALTYIFETILNKDKLHFSLYLIIISLSIIPFKLSGIFILIPLILYLIQYRSIKVWIYSALTGILILTPLLIKNYINTGYPLFPSTFSITHPDWMLPASMAEQFQEYVLNANKFYNQNIGFILNYKKTAFNWIPFWWMGILIQHKILLLLSILSFSLFLFTPIKNINAKKNKLFILSLWLMMTGWFITAPDPRFAYGFLLILAFLPISLLVYKFISPDKIYHIGFLLLTPILLYYTYKKSEPILKENKYFLSVINNDLPPYHTSNLNGANFYIPEKINENWNNRCFFIPLPCICESNPYLTQRGSSIKSGYRMNPITDSNFIYNYNY